MRNLDVFDLLELNLTDLWQPASFASVRTCVDLRIAAQRRKGRLHLKLLNVPGSCAPRWCRLYMPGAIRS